MKEEAETGYFQYGKAYQEIGAIPEKAMKDVKDLFSGLCDGIRGIGSFGTSGSRKLKDGAIQYDLRLFALRMEHNKKAHDLIREIVKKHDIQWLEYELLKKKEENNLFIISSDNKLWGIVW